jgi:CxxC motif-containing protein (DUF1111 family)
VPIGSRASGFGLQPEGHLSNLQPAACSLRPAIATAIAIVLASCARDPRLAQLLDPNSGGAATVHDATRQAFSQPAANLDVTQRGEFFTGNSFFNLPWVVAPASAAARDGLGPLFNARSCDACHNNDGRGRPPEKADERPISLVIQFGSAAHGKAIVGSHDEPQGDPVYGANLNPFAIGTIPAEGTLDIRNHEVAGKFGDGERYTLIAPEYAFKALAYGPLAESTRFSPRVAPAVIGSGLLEAIPDAQILERTDPDDKNQDGISGRANHVWNLRTQSIVLGRVSWKANQPDIAHQTAAAFSAEIGMSTSLRPGQNCTSPETACGAAPTGGEPEISDEIFTHIVNYQRMLGVPVRRHLESRDVQRGATLFLDAGCESCHRATFVTGDIADAPFLSKQTIHPFTDLLLHDMGASLADDRSDFEASGTEWRTPPLWGLGLQNVVNRHTRLLHDGRARDVTEAILWHDGEGSAAKEKFRTMSRQDRAALLAFLDSL